MVVHRYSALLNTMLYVDYPCSVAIRLFLQPPQKICGDKLTASWRLNHPALALPCTVTHGRPAARRPQIDSPVATTPWRQRHWHLAWFAWYPDVWVGQICRLMNHGNDNHCYCSGEWNACRLRPSHSSTTHTTQLLTPNPARDRQLASYFMMHCSNNHQVLTMHLHAQLRTCLDYARHLHGTTV